MNRTAAVKRISCSFVLLTTLFAAHSASAMTEQEALSIAVEAYVYGYPLITMETTRRVMTNVKQPKGKYAPMGQFAHLRHYPGPNDKEVTAPNADTLYSLAWLDLKTEPAVLHVPEEKGRYYLMPVLSAWTDVIASPGTRTTGTTAGDFLITGPGWNGRLPAGMKQIASPTNLVWILGRTYSTGSSKDYPLVHAIQDQYSLVPLSLHGTSYTPPIGTINPTVEMKASPRDQVNAMPAEEFFQTLAEIMKENPPAAGDAAILQKMAQLSIRPGKYFELGKLDPAVARGVEAAPKEGLKKILSMVMAKRNLQSGWLIPLDLGNYGTDYLRRAMVAFAGLGANLPDDAVYPTAMTDSQGDDLDGSNRYLLHFPKGKLPPVRGFWSLTMYDEQFFLVPNSLHRYTLSSRDALKANADGSVTIYLQKDSPGAGRESNWLPAPAGKFIPMLRLYWPETAVVKGGWVPPAVEKQP